jgi:hypothetical protein
MSIEYKIFPNRQPVCGMFHYVMVFTDLHNAHVNLHNGPVNFAK